jgi:hypothetical protein
MAAYQIQPIYIDPGTSSDIVIKIARDAAFTVDVQSIRKDAIIGVSRFFLANPGSAYPWPTWTELNIELHDGHQFKVELQNVVNQAGWNTGTAAAADQAVIDINASL